MTNIHKDIDELTYEQRILGVALEAFAGALDAATRLELPAAAVSHGLLLALATFVTVETDLKLQTPDYVEPPLSEIREMMLGAMGPALMRMMSRARTPES